VPVTLPISLCFAAKTGADCTLKTRPASERRSPFESLVSAPAFIKSAAKPVDFPPDEGREVAFVGRSNSGKSTALNLVAGVRKLARVSKTPGRTQLVNFFELGPERRLVDLPGYGFAKVPTATRDRWETLLAAYLTRRQSLVGVILTADIRRGLTPLDEQLLGWLAPIARPVIVLLTKSDKLSRGAGLAREQEVSRRLGAAARVTRFSAIDRTGVDRAREWLAEWLAPGTP
jgi:GTP-binding protein